MKTFWALALLAGVGIAALGFVRLLEERGPWLAAGLIALGVFVVGTSAGKLKSALTDEPSRWWSEAVPAPTRFAWKDMSSSPPPDRDGR